MHTAIVTVKFHFKKSVKPSFLSLVEGIIIFSEDIIIYRTGGEVSDPTKYKHS